MEQPRGTSDNGRVVVFTLLVVVVLALGLLGAIFVADQRRHQVFEVRLSIPALVGEAKANHGFPLNTWRIYDRQGRQVGEVGGPDDKQFRDGLNAVLQSPEPVGSTRTLAWEVSRLVDQSNRPVGKLREADFTLVKYWAESCKPCQDEDQKTGKVLQEILPSYRNLTINVLHVDVDVAKRASELANKPKQD